MVVATVAGRRSPVARGATLRRRPSANQKPWHPDALPPAPDRDAIQFLRPRALIGCRAFILLRPPPCPTPGLRDSRPTRAFAASRKRSRRSSSTIVSRTSSLGTRGAKARARRVCICRRPSFAAWNLHASVVRQHTLLPPDATVSLPPMLIIYLRSRRQVR